MSDPAGVPWLGARLMMTAREAGGAEEHRQIGRYIHAADAYILSSDLVRAVVETLESHTASIERNIDLIRVADKPIWIEFPDHARRKEDRPELAGAAQPVQVGALIARDEVDHDRFIVISGWDFPDGSVRHSYGVAAFSLTNMAQLAFHARRVLSQDRDECLERILQQASIYIPPGLTDEIRIVEEIDGDEDSLERKLDQAALDVAADIPFVLTALIAISTGQALLSRAGDKGPWKAAPNLQRNGWLSGALRGRGFVRTGKPDKPGAVWRLAAA